MRLLDQQLLGMCRAVGLSRDEAEAVYDGSSESVSRLLVRITEADCARIMARRAAAESSGGQQPVAAGCGAAPPDEPVGVGTSGWRRSSGASFSLSVRLDHHEVEELRRRAAERGVGASVLARAYIRKGLAAGPARGADLD